MKKKLWLGFLLFGLIFGLICVGFICLSDQKEAETPEAPLPAPRPKQTVIIDAGHGGEDGGTTGKTGSIEKDLNLLLAKDLASILENAGYEVILTRDDDRLLYDPDSDYQGHKKEQDLENRVKIANEHRSAFFVSIHMNSYPVEKYNGTQVFYSENNPRSQTLASNIANAVKERLQPENNRQIKSAKNIYTLEHIEIPAVLVECGFLSNYEEAAKLDSDAYRKQLAFCIYLGIRQAEESFQTP